MFKTPRLAIAVLLLALAHLTPAPAIAAGYDVSYLWHGQLPSVKTYRDKVANVLGPAVAARLRIVQKPGLYGLIYYRNGSSSGAQKVASVHTRLLRSRGLEAAAPTASRAWNFVEIPAPPPASRTRTHAQPEGLTAGAKAAEKPTEITLPRGSDHQDRITNLELAVEKHIKKLRARGVLANDERTAWSVYDFTTGAKLVSINEDVQFQAASMIKPFFAVAFFHKVANGDITYGPQSRQHMRRMIQYSNNYSTNWILRRIGGPAVAQRLLSTYYPHIFQDIHIVEYIPRGGRTYRNKASVHDYSRFLYAIWEETLPMSGEIKRLMSLPGSNRVYTGASAVPKGTRVYNKTGSTARLCGDMGILVVKDRKGNSFAYTLIGVIEKRARARNYTTWIRSRGDVIREVSNIVYEEISRHHNLRS